MWLCHNSAPDKGRPVNYVVKSMNETFRLELELFGILHKIIWSFWIIWKCQAHAPIACLSAYIQIFASLQEDLKLSVSFSEGPQHGETVSSDTLDIPYLPHTLILCLISWILRYRTGLFSQKTQGRQIGRNVVKRKCVAALGTIVKAHYCEWWLYTDIFSLLPIPATCW